MRKKIWENKTLSIQTKLIMVFFITSLIFLSVNIFTFIDINNLIRQIDQVYMSNVVMNELSDALKQVQSDMTDYLNTKNSDAIENYYRSEQKYRVLLERLNIRTTDASTGLKEKNIRNLSDSYLEYTDETVQSKRGRMIERYRQAYDNATELYEYINTYIYSLNNEQFEYNSGNYDALLLSFRSLEFVTFFILFIITIANIILAGMFTKSITKPLSDLAKAANEIGSGNFDRGLIEVTSKDEIGVVALAFNKMIISIQEYIEKVKKSVEVESAMKEKELIMETHLKDAELRYLQAQINPHFLFNTLNAGAQLAMMEEADRTYEFIQNMAAFFRYRIKKNQKGTTLEDEIRLVDNYVYILNVRFSGEIHYEKDIDESLVHIEVPSMILQPLVENAINYGVRDIEWGGLITLRVYRGEEGSICVSVKDNGAGMTAERIEQVLAGNADKNSAHSDSNGVGLDNVKSRLQMFFETEKVLAIRSDGMNQGTEVILYLQDMRQ